MNVSFRISAKNKKRLDSFLSGEYNDRSVKFEVEHFASGRSEFRAIVSGYIDPYNNHGVKEFCFGSGQTTESINKAIDKAFDKLHHEDMSNNR